MERKDFNEKFNELLGKTSLLLQQRADELWNSGGFDPADFEDNYLLPSIVLCVALDDAKTQWRPLTSHSREMVENLSHF